MLRAENGPPLHLENHEKKTWMGWAYAASTLALVATTFAATVVAVNAPG